MTAVIISHLYRVGDRVALDSRAGFCLKSDSDFTVMVQLPPLGRDFQYRIKSTGEPYERVALEHQLTLVSPHSEEPLESSKNSGKANRRFFPKPIV